MVFFKIDWAIIRRSLVYIFFAIAPHTIGCAPVRATPTPVHELTSTPAPFRAAICLLLPPANYGGTPIALPTLPPATLAIPERGRLIETRFHSELLDRQMPILIYLPPGYVDSEHRYPVLYMLAGYAGDYREWMQWGLCDALELLVRSKRIQPMIVVTPEGDHSWWFNHAPVPGSDGKPWGDYVWKDVVNYVDRNYRTLARRGSRAIGGLSAGGQGALMLALTHPEVFSVTGAHSPSVRGADGSIAFFGNREYFEQYDPIWLLENTESWRQLVIWIDVAAGDNQWGEAVLKLHNLLQDHGIPHEFHNTWDGIHDNLYWSARLPDYLDWYSKNLKGEP